MPSTSSEVLRGHFAAFESGGIDALAEFWHPEIQWRAVAGAADDVGVISGHDALRAYYGDWVETLDDLSAEVVEILYEADDRVAAVVRNSGRGRVSGVPVEGRYYVACVVRDGLIVAGREYATAEEATVAAPTLR